MSEADQASFFADTMTRAREAETRGGTQERFIVVADATVRLVFAGEALERVLYPAIAHLSVAATDRPDATFHVWDTESGGVEAPPSPCGRDGYTDRGDLWRMTSARYRSAFHWAEFSLNLMDGKTGEAVFWVRTPKTLPYWTRSSPFRTLFHWLMLARGKQLLHAAAVSTAEGAALIVGRGGVGKSTTALACLDAGLGYLGDDYVVVGLDREPCVFSLYNTAKLDETTRFPRLSPRLFPRRRARARRWCCGSIPQERSAEGIVEACAAPRLVDARFGEGGPARFDAVDASTLARAAAFTTPAQLPHAGAATHDFIGRLDRHG